MNKNLLIHIKMSDGFWYWKCTICDRLLAPHKEKWQYLQSKGSASRHLMTHGKDLVHHGRKWTDVVISNRFLDLSKEEVSELEKSGKVIITREDINLLYYEALARSDKRIIGKVAISLLYDQSDLSENSHFRFRKLVYEVEKI